jgi:hypothetical protein
MYKHGMGSIKDRHPLYARWCMIKSRCFNKNCRSYGGYGGAGVTLSEEWMDFMNFYRDMEPTFFPGASIDRIDNNKGYSKENCRWVTMEMQAKNKRTVPLYELDGVKLNARDWDRKLGFKGGTVRARIIGRGWSIERALTTPKKTYKGFHKDKRGKFRVEVKIDRRVHFVGRFNTEDEAKLARQAYIADSSKK